MITIRQENSQDVEAIYNLNVLAFGQKEEAEIVDFLRSNKLLILSLVAVENNKVVGHVAFSSVIVESVSIIKAIGLAPIAVLPDYQKQGIGKQLIQTGLQLIKEKNHDVVFVLGDSHYYSRFGFVAANKFGIKWEIDVLPEIFMVKELREGALAGIKNGIAKFHPVFTA